jgi:transposase
MTDPISRLNPALELLRQRLAEQAQRLESPAKGVTGRTGSAAAAPKEQTSSLKQRLSERLAAVDAADPQRDRKRRRVFIESVLASEFGEALHNDPKALELVERIEQTIQESPELERQFRTALSSYADG